MNPHDDFSIAISTSVLNTLVETKRKQEFRPLEDLQMTLKPEKH